jgi:hypothetical protein
MLNKIMAAAAVSALALTSAMAQTTSPSPSPSTPSTPPAATAPATPPAATAPSTSSSSGTSASNTANPAGKAKFVTKQTNEQWLATKFKGTDVIGTDDAKIGDVSDMLFDKDHKIIAYIVGVGGFLGIGQKDVAIAPDSFQMVPASATRSTGGGTATNTGTTATSNDHDNFKLRLSMTKDELKNAPAFEQYNARPATTSQAPATRPAGAPAPATAPTPKQ